MSPRLPLVEPHTREHTYCAYCPKLSRSACPVSTVQGRETTTPWGKMTILHHVATGNLPMEPSYAATWWACTGCMRCRTYCEHGNEVAAALTAGRAEAVRAGAAPAAAYRIIEEHPARERRAADAARDIFGEAMRQTAGTAFVPGCTACVVAPDDARAGFAAVRALSDGDASVVADRCCGLPLLHAGDRDGFVAAARRFVDAVGGAERVVFQDPGCLHALRGIAPRLGIEVPDGLLHLSELAAEQLPRLRRVAVQGPVRWHDPCRLGRGLGVYEAPRRVLEALLGEPAAEFARAGDDAECSGAGSQVPRTDPATARAIARERLAAHDVDGGGTVVTGCPGATRAFRRERGEGAALDLASLLARALEEPG